MGKQDEMKGWSNSDGPLFVTERGKGRMIYRFYAATVLVSIVWIWVYRATYIAGLITENGKGGFKWTWIGMFAAELWFGLYWVITQSVRWNPTYRRTFKQRLSRRYESDLPKVDIFVCTADPIIEPPMMVMNTVLSVMAYDYPPEKLSIYLSDDGGSVLTFYALTEAAVFARHWLPYCRNYKVEPRSPAAYFKSVSHPSDPKHGKDFLFVQKSFENMKNRIEDVMKLGNISEEIRLEHEGFSEWDSFTSSRDHDPILQILIDGTDIEARDAAGWALPTLVYLAREKRPQHFHNFKAGAMNALIRVSSMISNGPIILNVDCDMYSNSSGSVRDALCFFMDEDKGDEIAFVQFPQCFENVTKNEVYSGSLRVISNVDFHGLDGVGGPLYVGTGCFHRREILLGKKFSNGDRTIWKAENSQRKETENPHETGEKIKGLASCSYENNTQWGNEIGLKYGCAVEDVITGLWIQCQGWKSVFYNPERKGFLGVTATTLDQTLLGQKRWSEGDLQILLSKYSPAWYAVGKIPLGLQMGYLIYCFWSPSCLAMLYYSIFPSLCLLNNISLFPQVSSIWFLPFGYMIISRFAYYFLEFLWCGGTAKGWWNDRRMWLYRSTSSYLFALVDTMLGLMGFSSLSFVISSKVADEEVSERYEKEMMEFGSDSPMITTVATLAMLHLFCFVGFFVKKLVFSDDGVSPEGMMVQILLCVLLVAINMPLYSGLFVRKDKGKIPSSVTMKSVSLALFASTCFSFLW